MFKNAKKIALILGTLILCTAPIYATTADPSATRGEKPSVTKPETKPAPTQTVPENKPATPPVKPAPSTSTEIVPPCKKAKPETKPSPAPVVPETKPTTPSVKPEVKPETKPCPTPVKPSTKPEVKPETKPETKPCPAPVKPSTKPETKPCPAPVKPSTKPETKPTPQPVTPPAPNCKQTPYYMEYMKILTTMKQEMTSVQPTGNPSLDFLKQMIPHHQAAASMSENILKYTKNDEVKAIANSIIKEQKAGIMKMEKLASKIKGKKCGCEEKEAEYLQKYNEILNTMITKMESAQATCNDDVDFLTEMIPHHEGAIAMAKDILNYTNNSAVKKIAKNIVKSQEPQLKQMQELLVKLEK